MFIAFFCWPLLSQATVKVGITVSGIDGTLKENVLARLTINLQKNNERLHANALRSLHSKAKEDIEAALAPFGYYNPQIKSSFTKGSIITQVVYDIDKGAPILIEDIAIDFIGEGGANHHITKSAGQFPLQMGAILDQRLYEEGKKKLINRAITLGYLDSSFTAKELRVNRTTNTASINLTLNTGPQYFFGEIVSTQEVLKNDLLKRYFPFQEGEPYRPSDLFELQSILYKTDYFSRVSVVGLVDDPEGYKIPIQLELEPPEHKNKYSLGVGYATDTGVRGTIDWTNRLFNSKGHKMSALLQLAELENTLSFVFEVPVRDPRYNKVLHNVSYQDKSWDDTDTRLLTTAVSREYSGPKYKISGGLELRDEVYDIGNTSGDATLLIPSVNLGFIYADDMLNTKNGVQISLGVRGGIDGWLSDTSFLQATVGGKAIISPLEDWRVIGRGSLGATEVDSIDSLPPSLRFYTGGDSTIRGYSYKSIGTKDDSGTVIGGRYLVVGSIELERIFGQWWSMAAFWDAGTATDDLALDFYQGVGGGLRFRLPFGQIRLDVASAITEDDNPLQVHFTVGGDL